MDRPAAILFPYQRGINKKCIPLVLVLGNPLFFHNNKLGHKDNEQLRRDPALGEPPDPFPLIPLFRPLLRSIWPPDKVCHYKDPTPPPMRSPVVVGIPGIRPGVSPDRISMGIP